MAGKTPIKLAVSSSGSSLVTRPNVVGSDWEDLLAGRPRSEGAGDLIEGGSDDPAELAAQWEAFHNSECARMPERTSGTVGPEQAAYFRRVVAENPDLRWTFVLIHKPAWEREGGIHFASIEAALVDRSYAVFNGHVQAYGYDGAPRPGEGERQVVGEAPRVEEPAAPAALEVLRLPRIGHALRVEARAPVPHVDHQRVGCQVQPDATRRALGAPPVLEGVRHGLAQGDSNEDRLVTARASRAVPCSRPGLTTSS